MELTLNIYKKENSREVEKTYKADTIELMYGTVEDLICSIDFDKFANVSSTNNFELGKMVISLLPQIRPILKDIFGGLTDDEIKRTKVKELIPVFVEAFKFALGEIEALDGGNNSGN